MAKPKKPEIYFSTDIEADGPLPGLNSMLSLGACAILRDGTKLGTFSVNLEEYPGAKPNQKTMEEFWAKNPAAWAAARKDPLPPREAMEKFVSWVKAIVEQAGGGMPVLAAYPAAFDYMFIHWYLIATRGEDPFGISALDMKSVAMTLLNSRFKETTKRNMPKAWLKSDVAHDHVAVNDAIGQADLLAALFREIDAKTAA